ncbi:hypothetical protein RCL_jg10615.t1 [Rhizophagus clarus]|uniref:Uncharacterized protein n=1 Tax=Rhizophagus clarus TaxID=94130 RepID=A0A8H3L5C4_9GLOM|nr:hypothetical protein RCL_jg10615.t1 [Rhizophagus clarus]
MKGSRLFGVVNSSVKRRERKNKILGLLNGNIVLVDGAKIIKRKVLSNLLPNNKNICDTLRRETNFQSTIPWHPFM